MGLLVLLALMTAALVWSIELDPGQPVARLLSLRPRCLGRPAVVWALPLALACHPGHHDCARRCWRACLGATTGLNITRLAVTFAARERSPSICWSSLSGEAGFRASADRRAKFAVATGLGDLARVCCHPGRGIAIPRLDSVRHPFRIALSSRSASGTQERCGCPGDCRRRRLPCAVARPCILGARGRTRLDVRAPSR